MLSKGKGTYYSVMFLMYQKVGMLRRVRGVTRNEMKAQSARSGARFTTAAAGGAVVVACVVGSLTRLEYRVTGCLVLDDGLSNDGKNGLSHVSNYDRLEKKVTAPPACKGPRAEGFS